ncbi:hypothetical protein [Campylobacter showae]|nr:hypothetical protein [Campylobacter showae]
MQVGGQANLLECDIKTPKELFVEGSINTKITILSMFLKIRSVEIKNKHI